MPHKICINRKVMRYLPLFFFVKRHKCIYLLNFTCDTCLFYKLFNCRLTCLSMEKSIVELEKVCNK